MLTFQYDTLKYIKYSVLFLITTQKNCLNTEHTMLDFYLQIDIKLFSDYLLNHESQFK